MERLKRRSLNRARMPTVAAWVDAVRAAFGECRVAYAREGELEIETAAHREERLAIQRGERALVSGPFMSSAPFGAENEANSPARDE